MKKRRQASLATAIGLVLLMGGPAFAQWLKVPLAGTPRTPDGKPDLTAPAPRTPKGQPDLSGIWQRPRGPGNTTNLANGVEVQFQPSAEAVYQARRDQNGKGTPSEQCLPHGITKAMTVFQPFKIFQTPELIVMLYEEFNHHRQIFTDGRGFPANRPPTYFGYSLGTWEGDSMVVNTRGFHDDGWLDFAFHPATAALHLIERYRRRDFGHLQIEFTIDDPKAYVKPWTATVAYDLLPDTELIEHICDNEKDAGRIVGK
jgi:hypothetical protein